MFGVRVRVRSCLLNIPISHEFLFEALPSTIQAVPPVGKNVRQLISTSHFISQLDHNLTANQFYREPNNTFFFSLAAFLCCFFRNPSISAFLNICNIYVDLRICH